METKAAALTEENLKKLEQAPGEAEREQLQNELRALRLQQFNTRRQLNAKKR